MNNYIVILSIGPVQGMIASARRSRDLWSGSWLLSELAKTCAKFFKDNGATLIFPFIQHDRDLDENSWFSVGNKIQVQLRANDKNALKHIIDQAQEAVQRRLKQEADNVLSKLDKKDIRTDIWHAQIKDFVEIQSAWARIDDDYLSAVQLASQILVARKNTRNFDPAATCPYQSELMIPKSSLDALRETVLYENVENKNNLTRKKISLALSEQLDAVGVIKRLGFEDKAEQFTPISRVMADAWIEQLIMDKVDLTPIKEICQKLCDLGVMTKVTGNERKSDQKSIYHAFAYDAQLLYPSRLDAEKKAWQGRADEVIYQGRADEVIYQLDKLKQQLTPLWKKYGQPYSYGALLLADGDRMGELLDKAQNLEQHQAITQALSNFAGSVSDIMQDSRGHCIYAGGDDVLGLVPLDKTYDCANQLQKQFAQCLQEATQKLKIQNQLSDTELKNPTLSVGLAVCHIMTPFGVIRQLAKQAEKYAKGDHISQDKEQAITYERRNALGILLSVRGGTDIQVRFNWHDTHGLESFGSFVRFYIEKSIPSRVAYDIRDIHLRVHQIAADDHHLNQNIQSAHLSHMLNQACTHGGQKIASHIIKTLKNRADEIGLDRLADELIVARWLAAKTQKELGREQV